MVILEQCQTVSPTFTWIEYIVQQHATKQHIYYVAHYATIPYVQIDVWYTGVKSYWTYYTIGHINHIDCVMRNLISLIWLFILMVIQSVAIYM